MLVTFRTKSWGNVTMFGDVAKALLKMMGHSGTVPSALLAKDIPRALESLKRGLAAAPTPKPDPRKDDKDDEPPVPLQKRAYPLIQLLQASAAKGTDVTWEEGVPIP
jgi:hypothetical protein